MESRVCASAQRSAQPAYQEFRNDHLVSIVPFVGAMRDKGTRGLGSGSCPHGTAPPRLGPSPCVQANVAWMRKKSVGRMRRAASTPWMNAGCGAFTTWKRDHD